MKEVRSPKRPMIFYYCMVLLIIFLFNMLIAPLLGHSQVTEVGYNTFMDMIDDRGHRTGTDRGHRNYFYE